MPVETVDASLGIMGIFGGVMRYPEGLHVAVVMGGRVRSRRESTASTTNAQIRLMGLIGLIFQWLACR